MENHHIEELHETPSVAEANELLRTGWALVTIVESRRGHRYILGGRTALEVPASPHPALPASPNPEPCPAEGNHDHA